VNIDILGISELKWIGMSKLNSDDHYIYYYGQGPCSVNLYLLSLNNTLSKSNPNWNNGIKTSEKRCMTLPNVSQLLF